MATKEQRSFQSRIDQRENLLLKRLTESQKAARHKCFTSFHQADESEVEEFIDTFQDAFIPRVLGVSDEDDFIESDDTDYIMDQIREKYLTDSRHHCARWEVHMGTAVCRLGGLLDPPERQEQ